jgi:hypothetical protein
LTAGRGGWIAPGLAEVGEGGSGFGFDLTLGDGGKEMAQSRAEVASGEITVWRGKRKYRGPLAGRRGLALPCEHGSSRSADGRSSAECGSGGHRHRRKNTERHDPWRNE